MRFCPKCQPSRHPGFRLGEALTFVVIDVKVHMPNKRSLDSVPINSALSSFDSLPDSAHVRAPTVAALFGVSVVTVWRWSKTGKLPAPIKRGATTSWNVGALRRA